MKHEAGILWHYVKALFWGRWQRWVGISRTNAEGYTSFRGDAPSVPYLFCRCRAASDIAGAFAVFDADGGLPHGGIARLSCLLMACLSLSILKSKL